MNIYIFDSDVHSTDIEVHILTGPEAPVVRKEFHGKSVHNALAAISDILIRERQKVICATPPATVTSP